MYLHPASPNIRRQERISRIQDIMITLVRGSAGGAEEWGGAGSWFGYGCCMLYMYFIVSVGYNMHMCTL